jgi:hypothetical protein
MVSQSVSSAKSHAQSKLGSNLWTEENTLFP